MEEDIQFPAKKYSFTLEDMLEHAKNHNPKWYEEMLPIISIMLKSGTSELQMQEWLLEIAKKANKRREEAKNEIV